MMAEDVILTLGWERLVVTSAHAAWRDLPCAEERIGRAAASAVRACFEEGGIASGLTRAAERVVAAALAEHLPRVRAVLLWAEPAGLDDALPTVRVEAGEVLRFDAVLVAYLETIDPSAPRLLTRAAARFSTRTERPGEVYSLWQTRPDGAPRFLRLLALTLLRGALGDRFRPTAAAHVPAVAYAVLRAFQKLSTPGATLHTATRRQTEFRVLAPNHVVLGVFQLRRDSDPVLVQEGVERLMRTIEGERVWRALVRGAVRAEDGQALAYEGGIDAFRQAVGITAKGRAAWIVPILEALRCFRGEDGSLPEAVHSYRLTRAAAGRRATLEIEVGDSLRPMFASRLPKNQRRWRRLLPVLAAPPILGVCRSNARAILTLQWEVVMELHRLAREGSRAPSAALGPVFVSRLVARTGLGPVAVRAALAAAATGPEAWLTGGPDGYQLVDGAALSLLTDTAGLYGRQARGGRNLAKMKRGAGPPPKVVR